MLILGLFCGALLLCLLLDFSIIYGLIFGFLLFLFYGHSQGHDWRELFRVAFSGVKSLSGVIPVFALVGFLTALWRTSGTLPLIICYAVELIRPKIMVLMTFLLCSGVTFLIGSSVGGAATMGIICMTVGLGMGFPATLLGGAVLSGVYFGDRCSPVSTSGLLVSTLTKTSQPDNIRRMCKTALLPYLLACALYYIVGQTDVQPTVTTDLFTLFGSEFHLHQSAILPAVVLIALALMRVKIMWSMLASISASVVLALLLQHESLLSVLHSMIFGYEAVNEETASLLNGGGLVSMLKIIAIIGISSTYSGLFRETGLLDSVQALIMRLSRRTTPYCAMAVTALITGVVACNQTFTVMLTHQLCADIEPDNESTMIDLENSAIVIPPLIPWNIACNVPLSVATAPLGSFVHAYYLFLIIVIELLRSFLKRNKEKGKKTV